MSKMVWDQIGERLYETGIEQVALFPQEGGAYPKGVAWNGVTALNLTPSGAEATPLYANNHKYLTLMSVEELGGTIEAYMYPDEWKACDGSVAITAGVYIGQQSRKAFGLAAKTLIGNDTELTKHGYKLHLVYGCLASPSEEAHATVNSDPEVEPFSWEFSTTPVEVEGYEVTSHICIDSTKVDAEKLKALEAVIYGSDDAEPKLPLPAEVIQIMGGTTGDDPEAAG